MTLDRAAARHLALTLALAWGVGLLVALAQRRWLGVPVPAALGALVPLSPALVALALAARAGGLAGIANLLGALARGRVPPRVVLLVVVGPPLAGGVAVLLHRLLGGPAVPWIVPAGGGLEKLHPGVLLSALATAFAVSGLGEELGWRGWALPRLLRGAGALGASLVLAVAWAAWHVPLFLIEGSAAVSWPWYFAWLLGLSVIYTGLYNAALGNLLVCVLLHASIQATLFFLPLRRAVAGTGQPFAIFTLLTLAVALVILRRGGAETLAGPARAPLPAPDPSRPRRA